MAAGKLFIGRKVREIRLENKATQSQFADRIGISTSYLNQIESNQRPVSASVLITLADKFRLDLSELAMGETDRLLSALNEALSDPLFEGFSPSLQEMKLITHNAPGFAHALINCHQAYRRNSEQLAGLDQHLGKTLAEPSPWEEVRDFFHYVDNYVHDLDMQAESLANTLGPSRDQRSALVSHLNTVHGIHLAYVNDDAVLRHYDAEARLLNIGAYAPPQTQMFQLAVQVAQLEARDTINRLVTSANFRTEEAAEICRTGLHNYYAGALLMPYADFAQAAQDLRHDIELLALRFGASLEQICHRLSTLQRPSLKGVPIFFARIDRAGNITKRHSATKLQFARFGAACSLWNAHQAFETPGRIIRQLAETPDGAKYLSIAVQVTKGAGGFQRDHTAYVLGLGCEISYANAFVYADDLGLGDRARFDPIGVSCRICERQNCSSRAMPPLKRKLHVEHNRRTQLPYRLVE
jgi:predicted transcriptional regulator/transcriptional regulator with XRE-family HTH domain